jgi:2-polyprenyl-6-methoxyphenol hydroxylase-like FAD-dependent oxidoreductase
MFPKGKYQELRILSVQAVRNSIIEPPFAKHTKASNRLAPVFPSSVEANRCPRWHKSGLLLVGDAAHVMSPVGGVGINYAIQDAVVAANVLAGPLDTGRVRETGLAKVQRQRQQPTRVIQSMQSFIQERLIAGALSSRQVANVRLLVRIPIVGNLPAGLIAFGPRRVRISYE